MAVNNISSLLTSLIVAYFACSLSSCAGPNDGPASGVIATGAVEDAISQAPIPNVEVCIESPTPSSCSETTADGHYEIIGFPENEEVTLAYRAAGYITALVAIPPTQEDTAIPIVSLATPTLLRLQGGATGAPSVNGTGVIAFSISNGIPGDGVNVGQAQLALRDASGDGPFYTNESGIPDPMRNATSRHGGGVFVNVVPGEMTLDVVLPSTDCRTLLGWGPPTQPRAPVEPDALTLLRIECRTE